jgi:hypothetical protein
VEDVRIWQNKNVGRFEIQLRVLVQHVFDLRYRTIMKPITLPELVQ